MLKRAATVIWWLGAFVLAAIVCFAAYVSATADRPGNWEGLVMIAFGAGWAPVVAFCVAYVLGGSFWRPATGPLSKQEG